MITLTKTLTPLHELTIAEVWQCYVDAGCQLRYCQSDRDRDGERFFSVWRTMYRKELRRRVS